MQKVCYPPSRYQLPPNISSPHYGRWSAQQIARPIIRFALELMEWARIEPPMPSCQMDYYEVQVQWTNVLLLWLIFVPVALVLMLHVYPLLQLVPAAGAFCLIIRSLDVWQDRQDRGTARKLRRLPWSPPKRHSWPHILLHLVMASVCIMLSILWRFYFLMACLFVTVALLLPIILVSAVYRPIPI
eukprot:Gregarina_sp_Poly_1__3986@NODE_21_length_20913_cov_102_783268_g19_i0_p11_GENE_NODE_21_length_20913_cov_102_783268_g19_i0NODE_21_length_20913_cov_102_783268_g19_i0_p11_ORF_typecomplete_len186_score17_93DUF1700/PF08006_11/24DUF1700/PF08006_11/0_71LPG_synthase_TM/PF03706_13/0_18ABC2_membrane_2/PF12679_7/1_2e02ABC2_membrane_2/PF12679_7/0_74Ferlin_C/PF16165_5/2_7e02Ferlin_C/PF16165_5/3_7DUF3040/PF11239_8/80DUF3040/PF11239_8/5_2_NODE_21_length_20913_cov_102_783268_g19_i01375614313